MCTFVSFSGHCFSFQHFTINCHSRIFKLFYLEMNLCRKCSENENEVQFCAHQLKFISDWFLERERGTLKLASQLRLGFDVGSVIFISFPIKNKKPVSLSCEITPVLGKKHCLQTLKNVDFVARTDTALNVYAPHSVKKPFNPLTVFTVGKIESNACICGPKCALRRNFGHFEPKILKKKNLFFLIKMGVCFQELIWNSQD